MRLARVPRLYRLLRILRLFKLMRVFKYQRTFKSVKITKMNAGVSRMLKTMAVVFLLVHLMSCFWFLASKMDDFSEETWVYQKNLLEASMLKQYLMSCNWALQTLTTVGYGGIPSKTIVERCLSIIWMFFGAGFYSFTIGNLAQLISNIDIRAAHLQQKLTMLQEFSKRKRLPENLEQRIKKFIENNH